MSEKIQLKIVTPTRVMYDEIVDMVIVRGVDGELGFMPGHVPLVTILGYSITKIVTQGETREVAILGGFVEFADNMLIILTDIAEWPEEIDVKRAGEARERAERRLSQSGEHGDIRRAELALRRATVRLEVSAYPIIKGRV